MGENQTDSSSASTDQTQNPESVYYLHPSDHSIMKMVTTPYTDMTTLVKLLHLRLCHLPFSRLKVMFPHLDTKTVQENVICSICPAARQTRLTFLLAKLRLHLFLSFYM